MTGRTRPRTGFMRSDGCGLYYEEAGGGVPILLIHPAGATATTWGPATAELARIGRVITYDRRGDDRSGGEPARATSTHTADAAAILECLQTAPAVVDRIEGGGHAAPFDATANFVQLIAVTVTSRSGSGAA